MQSKQTLDENGTLQICSEKGTPYLIEEKMPLNKTPRPDLYFNNSELTILSLLNTICIKYLCKNDDEYCHLKFEPRPLIHPPPSLDIDDGEKTRK